MGKEDNLTEDKMILTDKIMGLYYEDKLSIDQIHERVILKCDRDFVEGVVYSLNNFLMAKEERRRRTER